MKKRIAILVLFLSTITFAQNSVGDAYTKLVWSDEFDTNGAIDISKWHHQTQLPATGSWYNGEIQHYTNREANSYVENGVLKIIAKKENYSDQGQTKTYTSARLNSKFAFTNGKIEVRAKMPTGTGTWPAIWMLGKNISEDGAYWDKRYGTRTWPACGELDIIEHWGVNQNYVQSAIHTPASNGNTVNKGGKTLATVSSKFHTYSMVWTEEEIIFSIDGEVHYTYNPTDKNSSTWPFTEDQYLLLNLAVESEATFTEAAMEVDYVRVYKKEYHANKIYVHTVNRNPITAFSIIDHPDLNNNPDAQVIVKQHYKSSYNNHPIGVYYSTDVSKWVIYNEDSEALNNGAIFNVFIGDNKDNFFKHTATALNQGSSSSFTVLDSPLLNENPDSFVFITNNLLGSGSGNTVFNTNRYSTNYNATLKRRQIFEAGGSSAIPSNASFNIFVGDSENSFSHTTTSSNIINNQTILDHPALNNNPNATFIFEHYKGTELTNNWLLDKNLGVWYNGNRWTIFTQDKSEMIENVRFSILIALQDIYTAIPDANFEQALIDLGYDDVIDGKVLTANIEILTYLDVSNKQIKDLTGIENFVKLETLVCSGNQLTTLDISKNTALKTLDCSSNNLTTLDVSNNIALEQLDCSSNVLTSLNVIPNTSLWRLSCNDNQLTTLSLYDSVIQNTSLTQIYAHNNQLHLSGFVVNVPNLEIMYLQYNLFTNISLENNTNLYELNISDNQLSTLDLSKNTVLKALSVNRNKVESINIKNGNNDNLDDFYFVENPNLTCIQVDDVYNINDSWNSTFTGYSADCYVARTTAIPDPNFEQALITLEHDDVIDGKVLTTNISSLTTLDVSDKEIADLTGIEDFVALKNLQCHTNKLTTLDVSKNTALDNLNCSKNKLTNLNLSNNTDLHTLWAFDNKFNTLDVSNNIALKDLNIPRNQLITIDVSNNIHLINLYCGENLISSLDISNNTALKLLWVFDNKLTTLDVSKNIALTDLRILNNPLLEAVNLQNRNNASMNQFIFNNTPKLTCIQVDDVDNINDSWNSTFTGYSADCFDTLSTENLVLEKILQVYPNPVQETLYIKTGNGLTINEVQLYDVRGKMIRKEKEVQENISLKELNSGIYFVKTLTNKGVQTRKIIKE